MRYRSCKLPMPSGSFARAETTTGCEPWGSTGPWLTSKIAGPALATRLEFGSPGVPQLAGTFNGWDTSIQFPRTRSKTYGEPFSQRTEALIVPVFGAAVAAVAVRADAT